MEDFIKEALELNTLLSKKQEMLCQKLSFINPLCVKSDSLMNQSSDMRVTFNDIDDKISRFITWHDTPEGRAAPRIDESQKEILFTDWDIQLKHAERAVSRANDVANNIIKTINDNLHNANLIQEFPPSNLPDIKVLERQWKETSKPKEEAIKKLTKFN